jgi:hypothetical protein
MRLEGDQSLAEQRKKTSKEERETAREREVRDGRKGFGCLPQAW